MKPESPVRTAINLIVTLLLLGLAWGNVRRFYADPVRAAGVLLMVVPALVLSRRPAEGAAPLLRAEERAGVRHLGTFLRAFGLLLIVILSALGIGTLPGGEAVRYAGLFGIAAGSALRAAAMASLGSRHSLDIALLPDHRLQTSGLYARIRHPSYLGWLLMALGFALLFRSGPGLLVFLLTVLVLVLRMRREEAFLLEHFGEPYRRYISRTSRLLPRIY